MLRYKILKNNARKWLANQKAAGKPWRINIGSSNDQYAGWLATEEQYLDLLKEYTWLNLFDKPANLTSVKETVSVTTDAHINSSLRN